ncbi:phosphotransferase [Yoonia sp. 208BN28-4]|uniref:phosphotransferase n=1 Tax=Yoonia sp. 208BN28-4 TaxID=3126505 RepID=UPI0030A98544
MKLNVSTDDAAAARIAHRWNLTLSDCVADTPRARVFRATGAQGDCALKLYRKVGASGEGAATQFLRALPDGLGVRVYRMNTLRTAVLMEWLDGTPLDVIAQTDMAQATALLAQVAHDIGKVQFRRQFAYQRVAPLLFADFAKAAKRGVPDDLAAYFNQARSLLVHLIDTSPPERVIHGDLGFQNVMLTPGGPRAFDPKGWRADPAVELALSMIRPFEDLDPDTLSQRIAERGAVFADATGASQQRLIQWAAVSIAQQVLCRSRTDPRDHPLYPVLPSLLAQAAQG